MGTWFDKEQNGAKVELKVLNESGDANHKLRNLRPFPVSSSLSFFLFCSVFCCQWSNAQSMSHKVIMIWPLLWRWPLGRLCRSVWLLMWYVWRQFFSCCFSLDPCWSPSTHLGRIRNQIAPCTCKLGNQIDSPLGLHPACCLLVLLGPEANTTTRSNCCNDCGDVYFMVLGGCSQY